MNKDHLSGLVLALIWFRYSLKYAFSYKGCTVKPEVLRGEINRSKK